MTDKADKPALGGGRRTIVATLAYGNAQLVTSNQQQKQLAGRHGWTDNQKTSVENGQRHGVDVVKAAKLLAAWQPT